MNADRIDYYVNLMRGVSDKDIGRKMREILIAATEECEKTKKKVFLLGE